tara:strand:- start:15364 stop:15768 length:405 start_codon:yes stop_codon:yes gene_type:complete
MEWIDNILDHVSQYKLENITKVERKYLQEYGTQNEKNIEDVLNERVNYYEQACLYDIEKSSFYDPDVWEELKKSDIKETRLNILWDIVLDDDFETFMKIYEIPIMVLGSEWTDLPKKYQERFEDFWKSYYKFNI